MLKFFEGYNEVVNVKTNHKICKVFDWSHEWKNAKMVLVPPLGQKTETLNQRGKKEEWKKIMYLTHSPLLQETCQKLRRKVH